MWTGIGHFDLVKLHCIIFAITLSAHAVLARHTVASWNFSWSPFSTSYGIQSMHLMGNLLKYVCAGKCWNRTRFNKDIAEIKWRSFCDSRGSSSCITSSMWQQVYEMMCGCIVATRTRARSCSVERSSAKVPWSLRSRSVHKLNKRTRYDTSTT